MPALTRRRRTVDVLGAAALIILVTAALIAHFQGRRPPIQAADAGLTGQVWTMPADQARPFLRSYGVDATPPAVGGTVVVARVTWSPNHTDAYFTVIIGDRQGRSGVIQYVYGPPSDEVTLGNGSMWDDALAQRDWLAGDGTQALSTGGYSSFGQFASVPADWSGEVWAVGHVTTPPAGSSGLQPDLVENPQPVLGVGLSSGDHVWWIHEIARA